MGKITESVSSEGKRFVTFKCNDGKDLFVKVIEGVTDEADTLRYFLREVEVQLLLAHPEFSVFRGFSLKTLEGPREDLYLFFRQLPRSLSMALQAGDLDVTDAACIVYGVVVLVDYIHQHKIAHRDIKCENVLLDDDNKPWFTDFGLSRGLDHGSATTSIGTNGTMAPEMSLLENIGVDQTFLADMFSLGVLLFRVIWRGDWPYRYQPSRQRMLIDNGLKKDTFAKIVGEERVAKYDKNNLSEQETQAICTVAMGSDLAMKSTARRKEIKCQPGLEELIKKCISPLPDDRMSARELRQGIEKLTPNEMFSWKGEFPKEGFCAYQERMRKNFPM